MRNVLYVNGVDPRPGIDAAECLVIAVATGEVDELKAVSPGLREPVVAAV